MTPLEQVDPDLDELEGLDPADLALVQDLRQGFGLAETPGEFQDQMALQLQSLAPELPPPLLQRLFPLDGFHPWVDLRNGLLVVALIGLSFWLEGVGPFRPVAPPRRDPLPSATTPRPLTSSSLTSSERNSK